jgi:hypothetical protein
LDQANQLAAIIGRNAGGDVRTFRSADWQDSAGNLYAVASTLATETFPQTAAADLSALAEQRLGTDHPYDVAAAQAAQSALVVWQPEVDPDTGELLQPAPDAPDALLAVIWPDQHQAVEWLGLERAEDVPGELV